MCHDTGCSIPFGLCHCGCGASTNPAPCTDASKGWIKDQPKRFIVGHSRRKSPVEYIIDTETGCHIWQRGLDGNGYGVRRHRGKTVKAYIVAYVAKYGPVPPGKELDHKCRNKPCVNADHLEPVTHTVNVQRGAKTKLTADDVAAIRTQYGHEPVHLLAERFSVTPLTIWHVATGRSWKNVHQSLIPAR